MQQQQQQLLRSTVVLHDSLAVANGMAFAAHTVPAVRPRPLAGIFVASRQLLSTPNGVSHSAATCLPVASCSATGVACPVATAPSPQAPHEGIGATFPTPSAAATAVATDSATYVAATVSFVAAFPPPADGLARSATGRQQHYPSCHTHQCGAPATGIHRRCSCVYSEKCKVPLAAYESAASAVSAPSASAAIDLLSPVSPSLARPTTLSSVAPFLCPAAATRSHHKAAAAFCFHNAATPFAAAASCALPRKVPDARNSSHSVAAAVSAAELCNTKRAAVAAVKNVMTAVVASADATTAAAEDGTKSAHRNARTSAPDSRAPPDGASFLVGGVLHHSQQRLFYYRFHKHIGKGNFNRYIEFYQKPRGVENTLRLRFNYFPTFSEKKRSLMWNIYLMKKLARATDSKQVLDIWTYYRHKKYKRPYHYIAALRRLVEVGGCDPTDYRFRLIANGVLRSAKRFLNLPRVSLQFAQLNARGDLQQLSRFLLPRISSYFPHQLCVMLHAFGLAKLQDKQLFSAADEALRPHLPYLSTANLIKIAGAFAGVLLHNYGILAQISMQLQLRAAPAHSLAPPLPAAKEGSAAAAAVELNEEATHEGATEDVARADQRPPHDDLFLAASSSNSSGDMTPRMKRRIRLMKNEQQEQQRTTTAAREPQREQLHYHQGHYYPSFSQLVAFASACATLKYREFGFLELLSLRMQTALRRELEDLSEDAAFQSFSPHTVEEIVKVLLRLKINDIPLLLLTLQHIDARLCDYPPSCLASIGACSAQLLPCSHPLVRHVYQRMLDTLEETLPVLDLHSMQQVAVFAKKMKRHWKDVRGEGSPILRLYEKIEKRVVDLQGDVRTVFDVPRLLELLSLNERVIGDEAFTVLCVQTHRHLELFEPVDFCRMARALARIAATSSKRRQLNAAEGRTEGGTANVLTSPTSPPATAGSVKQQHSLDVVNALARRALRLHDEFSLRDFSSLLRHLRAAGPPHQHYALPLQQRLREKEKLYPEEAAIMSRNLEGRSSSTEAASPPATDFEVSAEQLPSSTRKAAVMRRGRLLLGREAARRHGKNQLLEEQSRDLPGSVPDNGEVPAVPEEAHYISDKSEVPEKAAERWRRRRLEARLRIAEEEGWNLLHRRVASLRELRGWL